MAADVISGGGVDTGADKDADFGAEVAVGIERETDKTTTTPRLKPISGNKYRERRAEDPVDGWANGGVAWGTMGRVVG